MPMRIAQTGRRAALILVTAVFLSSIAAGCAAALYLYGKPRPGWSAIPAAAVIQTLASSALSEVAPSAPQSLRRSALMFTWLSLGELSIEAHRPLQTRRRATPSAGPGAVLPLFARAGASAGAARRLVIGWTLDTGSANLIQTLRDSPGLTVLAPKWIQLDGSSGAINNTVEPSVVQAAQARGVQVWAVVDNGFNAAQSHAVLRYQDTQTTLIDNIVNLARRDHLSGINLDFEGLAAADRWNYARFVQRLAVRLRAVGMSLSVDLPPDIVSGQNSGPYNHAALAASANYIILMGYDQYWGGDSQAGPTASLPWVKAGVTDMLHTGVPAAKLILGVPFYTQDWTLDQNGAVSGSRALSLVQVHNLLAGLGANPEWRPSLGVSYASFTQGGVRHEMWVISQRSLLLTSQYMAENHLAGVAAWYLGLERPSTWWALVQSVHSLV